LEIRDVFLPSKIFFWNVEYFKIWIFWHIAYKIYQNIFIEKNIFLYIFLIIFRCTWSNETCLNRELFDNKARRGDCSLFRERKYLNNNFNKQMDFHFIWDSFSDR
jgi:hypothetical protein